MIESRLAVLAETLTRPRPSMTAIRLRRHRTTPCSSRIYWKQGRVLPTSRPDHRQFHINHRNDVSTTSQKKFETAAFRFKNKSFDTGMPSRSYESGQGGPSKGEGDDDWKNRPPYRTVDTDGDFVKRHTAHCHCGRVKCWLSREKPLAAKFCHCVDCQALHGMSFYYYSLVNEHNDGNNNKLLELINIYAAMYRGAVSMGCHISQGRLAL